MNQNFLIKTNEFFKRFVLLLIGIGAATSAKLNLNSLNAPTKSLDTFNQTKITLNNSWYYKDDDPITLHEIQETQQHKTTRDTGKLLLKTIATAAATRRKGLQKHLSYQKPLKTLDIVQQQEPNYHHHRNSNHFYHYLTTLKFNKRNNENNHDNFHLNDKLETITAYEQYDAKEILQNSSHVKEVNNVKQNMAKLKEKKEGEEEEVEYQKKYYVPVNDNWLGHLPQFQLQTQQLQLFLQQQTLRQPSATSSSSSLLSMAAAFLLPQDYQHLADYRLFFKAERHIQFYLHTLATQNNFVTHATKPATATLASFEPTDVRNRYINYYNYNYEEPNNNNDNEEHNYGDDDDDNNDAKQMANLANARVLNILTDTIRAAFGVTSRPVAAIENIQIEEIELYNGLSLRQSRFNPLKPCRILIHGWLGGSKAGLYNTLVPEYFKLQQGAYNIITVDWGKGALADYITASYRVKPVGILVAKFVDFLHQASGIALENIHIIGFSMGAHVAGIAGKYVKTGRLAVIYGLDPALPLFRYANSNERLDASDANYVEVIHTSVGSYGYDRPLGHVDFYVNFGYNQPGCFFNECSHFRAFKVYAQSLGNEMLKGVECSRELWWDMIKYKRCLRQMGRSLHMGVEGLRASEMALRRGLYYVMTNAQPPYNIS